MTEQKSPDLAARLTMAEAINLALHETMASDPTVVVLGEDVADPEGGGVRKVTNGLSTAFGEDRVRSTPISEQAIAGAAIGAALAGLRPVAEIMLMNFITIAMDMIVNHAAKLRYMSGGQTGVPVTFITMTGAGRGVGGQHSDWLEAWFAHTPGMKVVIPSSPAEAYGLIKSCIADPDPCLFVEPMALLGAKGPAPTTKAAIPLGKANIVRPGRDVSVITYGRQVGDCLSVTERFADEGVDVEVIDLRTIAPMDMETIHASVTKTGRAVIVHEAVVTHGVGAEIAAQISAAHFSRLKVPVERVGSNDSPVPFARHLEMEFMPDASRIEAAIRRTLVTTSV